MSYKQAILDLNYCLYSRLTKTVFLRDDCAIALNPLNKEHQQSNLCYRIRLGDGDFISFVQQTRIMFDQAGCQPRYHMDESSTPSLPELCNAFTQLGYRTAIDTDLVMSWNRTNANADIKSDGTIQTVIASLKHLDDLTRVFSTAYGYGKENEWLHSKLEIQLGDPQTFPIMLGQLVDTGAIVCAVILHTPTGLPHLGHVNAVATDPEYQRKGYSTQCVAAALNKYCRPQQTFYLEVYDDLYHAHRMYEKIGFKCEGLLKTSMIALE